MIKKVIAIVVNSLRSYFIIFHSINTYAQNVELTIKGIRSTKGTLQVGVFKDNESFKKEKSYKELKFAKTNIVNGILTVEFNLEPGLFGFALLDDENSNTKMDYNFIGYPLEGFGFSNYYHRGLTKPNLNEFSFNVARNSSQKVVIEIRYM